MLGLAQPGSVVGSAICCVLNVRTTPAAPESTEADTMSVAADASLALVSRLIVSPAGSVIAAGPVAATAGPGDTNPAMQTSPATENARPAALLSRTNLPIRHPQLLRPRAGQAFDGAPPEGNWGGVRRRSGEFLPIVRI